jgi:hypothetical protein
MGRSSSPVKTSDSHNEAPYWGFFFLVTPINFRHCHSESQKCKYQIKTHASKVFIVASGLSKQVIFVVRHHFKISCALGSWMSLRVEWPMAKNSKHPPAILRSSFGVMGLGINTDFSEYKWQSGKVSNSAINISAKGNSIKKYSADILVTRG